MNVVQQLLKSVLGGKRSKRRSVSPGIPGYAGQRDGVRPKSVLYGGRHGISYIDPGPAPKVYMGDVPTDYNPHPGPMIVPSADYEPYDGAIEHQPTPPPAPPLTPAPAPATFWPPVTGIEWDFELQRNLIGKTASDQQARPIPPTIEAQPPLPVDISDSGQPVDINTLTNALTQLRKSLPEDHPDVLRLSTALQAMQYDIDQIGDARHDSGLPRQKPNRDVFAADPYDAAELFDKQVRQFDEMAQAWNAQESALEAELIQRDPVLEGLEQIAQQEEAFIQACSGFPDAGMMMDTPEIHDAPPEYEMPAEIAPSETTLEGIADQASEEMAPTPEMASSMPDWFGGPPAAQDMPQPDYFGPMESPVPYAVEAPPEPEMAEPAGPPEPEDQDPTDDPQRKMIEHYGLFPPAPYSMPGQPDPSQLPPPGM